jgi:hypothetical protein
MEKPSMLWKNAAQDRRDGRDGPNEVGTKIYPSRAFPACLALHAPRILVLEACFSILRAVK